MSPVSGLRTAAEGDNPKEVAGSLKDPLTLVPQGSVRAMARAFACGADKYGPYNWRVTKVRARVYIEAAMRHLGELLDGLDADPESGENPAAHVMASMAIYLDAMACGTLVDDRPVPLVKVVSVSDVVPETPKEEIDSPRQYFTNKPRRLTL